MQALFQRLFKTLSVSQFRATVLLVATHAFAAFMGFGVGTRGTPEEVSVWIMAVLAILLGAGAGFVLTFKFLDQLGILEIALVQFVKGQTLQLTIPGARSPFEAMFRALSQFTEQQKFTSNLRDDLVQQISATASQEERNRLARDLHDSIKQQLFSISVSAAAVQARWSNDPDAAQAALQDVRSSVQEAMGEMTAMLQQLAPVPLERVGLIQALNDQCTALGYRTGAQVTIETGDLPDETQLPVGTQESLFRMAQEALSNIARHARARHVHLTFAVVNEALNLQVEDDGQGFDSTNSTTTGMGLSNIRTRAERLNGTVAIESVPGQGTRVTIRIPMLKKQTSSSEDDMMLRYQPRVREAAQLRGTGLGLLAILVLIIGLQGQFNVSGAGQVGWWLALLTVSTSLIVGVGFLIQSRRRFNLLVLQTGTSSVPTQTCRQLFTALQMVWWLWTALLLPSALLEKSGTSDPIFAMCLGFLLIALLLVDSFRVFWLSRGLILRMSLAEQQKNVDAYWASLLPTCISVGSTIFVIALIPPTIRFPPLTPAHWIEGFFVLAATWLIVGVLVSVRFYWRLRQSLRKGEVTG